MACQHHLDGLARSAELDFEYRFDARKAVRIIRFFSGLQLTKGLPVPGRPFVPEPWQQFLLASLFGWVHKQTGLRRFRHGHILVPRKNGTKPRASGTRPPSAAGRRATWRSSWTSPSARCSSGARTPSSWP